MPNMTNKIPKTRTITLAAIATITPLAAAQHTQLSPADKAAGWEMLFDGETWEGWTAYGKDAPPAQGWKIEDGTLRVVAGGGGGDVVTKESFDDFELALEFKVSKGANSGIIYLAATDRQYPWFTGPEYQILDDPNNPENQFPSHTVGSVYDLYVADEDKPTKPFGEWNTARIRVADGIVQHFLNGKKVAQYDANSDAWKKTIAGSKFRDMEGFGLEPEGHIALQDHGNDVWFRNIKIRDLGDDQTNDHTLFPADNADAWTTHLRQAQIGEETFTHNEDGVLVCTGAPHGYIRTTEKYDDFVLNLSWRYTGEPGNSGVLIRTVGEDKVWPDCIEAQLHSGQAGDFVNLSKGSMTMPRTEGIFGRRSHTAENPVGEWNHYEIIANGGEVTLFVNGEMLNHATDCPTRAGSIALQSEGVPIEFKDITITPIKD